MWVFWAAVMLVQDEYAERLGRLDDAVVAARQKAAAEFEKLKAWAWAREEYAKILFADSHDEEARRKTEGEFRLPRANEKLGSDAAEKYWAQVRAIGDLAAGRHVALAKWCSENGRAENSKRHWRMALLYAPSNADAISGLGMCGTDAAAVDPVWKDVKWKEMVAKADAGKELSEASDIERRWSLKNVKRAAPTFTWEGVDVPADHVRSLARQGEAAVAFMRKALGDDTLNPCAKKWIVVTGKSRYVQYVDDFVEAPDATKELIRRTGGMQNIPRDEFIQWAYRKGDDRHDHCVAHVAAEFMLTSALDLKDCDAPPAWIKEGVGCMVDILFRGKMGTSCVAIPQGTTSEDVVPWSDSDRWDDGLRSLVDRGRDPALADVIQVTLNAMKGDQRAKSASLIRFLVLRWPSAFRSIVGELKRNSKDSRGAIEKGTGLSIHEVDEFWRRWIRMQQR